MLSDKDGKQQGLLHIAGGGVNWDNFGKHLALST